MIQVPVLVISLPGSPRRPLISARLAKRGIAFSFIDAFDGRNLDAAARAELCDDAKTIRRIGRVLTGGEIGCALSHQLAYRFIAKAGWPEAVILEDDAMPEPGFSEFCRRWKEIPEAVELLMLYAGGGLIHRHARAQFQNRCIARAASAVEGCCAYLIRAGLAQRFLTASPKIAMVADWPLPPARIGQYVMHPNLVEHDFSQPSEVGEDRPSFVAPKPPLTRKIEGLRAVSLLPYLRHQDRFDGLYNYYERELRVRIKSRMTWRYRVLDGGQRWQPWLNPSLPVGA